MSRVFDRSGSLRRMGGDEQLFQDMVGFLQEDAPRLLARIDQSLHQDNWEQAVHGVHTLKGLVSNFGAQRAVSVAESLEQRAAQHSMSLTQQDLRELEAAVNELQTALVPFARNAG
jgi:HPt (histidine-containing phosphotransfer) domain-containing protein